MRPSARAALCLGWLAVTAAGLTPREILIVANGASPVSRSIAEYYARRRGVPAEQILYLRAPESEEIDRATYNRSVAVPVAQFLRSHGWADRILCLVTTTGVPLKIRLGEGSKADAASVDSELATLYSSLKGRPNRVEGSLPNPYSGASGEFRHPDYPMYLVTRLTGYTFADVRAAIDRAIQARNRGVVVLDEKGGVFDDGNLWLKAAANRLPPARVKHDATATVLAGITDVIGYAGWGSNDPARTERDIRLTWLPGGIATEFVSTDGRTFTEPPSSWRYSKFGLIKEYWAGSPQSLSADWIRQGATGASGHVYEPYLTFTPRPDMLFPAYLGGRTLAESFWSAIPALSWMNIVIGDPLCRLAP